jgi:3-methyladenine DNA glycosylase AlkD
MIFRMKLKETLAQLEAFGNEKVRAQNTKNGASDNQYGLRLGDIRKLAKEIKPDHELGLALWETEMGTAAPEAQWTVNFCLGEIGIHFPEHRKRALTIGETLGVFRDYPVSKGCTSPFAPI